MENISIFINASEMVKHNKSFLRFERSIDDNLKIFLQVKSMCVINSTYYLELIMESKFLHSEDKIVRVIKVRKFYFLVSSFILIFNV